MRIYEIDDYYHIDLKKIVAIRQFMNKTRNKDRANRSTYEYWIDITIDSGRNISIEFPTLEKMSSTYDLLLKAWQTFVGDDLGANLEIPGNGL